MEQLEIIPHLFRTEYRKIVSVLSKHFGFDQVEIAEDIASETFLVATQSWGIEGLPQNPTAWLYKVAQNKAKTWLHRHFIYDGKILPEISKAHPTYAEDDIDLSAENITDSQLQMMFAICHPAISTESQVGLSLRILCGFGIDEIAAAFLSNKETINKRLFRAREKLREENIKIELPNPTAIDTRLESVLTTIYLLFNEGYYSANPDKTLRKDLCLEAIRLCTMLIENEATNKPEVNALLALMCFHISRFEARVNQNGEIVLYDEQDRNLWNADWIAKGGHFIKLAASGRQLSKYHLEAGIAYWHTVGEDSSEKWENILQLYNRLLQIEYSPVAALNRTYALSRANGKEVAIAEAEKLQLTNNHFYFVLLGELFSDKDWEKAKSNFKKALELANSEAEKQVIQKKISQLTQISNHP